jgi:hypothetical protein
MPAKGCKQTEETKQKLREINLGRKHTNETRQKMHKPHKSHIVSGETKNKIGAAHRGIPNKPFTAETIEKLRKTHTGKKHTEESKRKMSEGLIGHKPTRWNGGRWLDGKGYVYILNPDHPNCTKQGYIREHRLIMENKMGRLLSKTEIVHHINGNILDNDINNLRLFSSVGEHVKYHKSKLNSIKGE